MKRHFLKLLVLIFAFSLPGASFAHDFKVGEIEIGYPTPAPRGAYR